MSTLILGAGLAGLSASYHIGHQQCRILEKKSHAFGHLHSEIVDGFTWDEGPHVSFTKSEYVRQLFAESVNGEFQEYSAQTANYFRGTWISHPAQSSLYQIPEPLRSECLESFLATRTAEPSTTSPQNYQQWLEMAFGPVFANTFPAAYTRKYWTREPRHLGTSWIGHRVFFPSIDDVVLGSKGPLDRATHYVTTVRYPTTGGFQSFVTKLAAGAQIEYKTEICRIDLQNKIVWSTDGKKHAYEKLINTLPLPVFIAACADAPSEVREAANNLSCSQLLLVNTTAPHPTRRPENWIYVYDEDKYSTRINCTELLSPNNAPRGSTGIQTEVYFSRHKPLDQDPLSIGKSVVAELETMGLVDASVASFQIRHVPWANVIFDLSTAPCLDIIWRWLATKGLTREPDDLEPLSDNNISSTHHLSPLSMAGRFGQWKYFWTDDCVLRGRKLAH